MVLIRLTYASELPTPGELVKRLAAPQGGAGVTPDGPAAPVSRPGPQAAAATQAQPDSEAAPISAPESRPQPTSFAEVVALAAARREALLANHLAGDVHLVHFEPGRIELRPEAGAPRDLAGRLGGLLQEWTGERWVVSVSDVPGAPTLRSQQQEYEASRRAAAQQDPLVRAVLETFPGAKMVARRDQPTSGAERPEATPQSTAASGDGRNREEGET
jgi:DNA polymerase-3 subunit gamma/tau